MATTNQATLSVAEKQETKIISLQNNENNENKKTEVKNLPIDELKNRAIALNLLTQKNDELHAKRKRLERFAIIHDQNNAAVTVVDANGEKFVSTSPKSIKKLIEFWQEEFKEAIAENEAGIQALFA